MKITLFGGAGFLGSNIARRLLAEGYLVQIFDKPGSRAKLNTYGLERVTWVEGDFENLSNVKNAVSGSDVILNLVSTTMPKDSLENIPFDLLSNAVPAIQLLECAKSARVKKVLFFSSGGTVYGDPLYIPIDESHPTNPLVPYGVTKLAIEKYCLMYQKLYDLRVHILRISNPYGFDQLSHRTQGAVGIFLSRAINDLPIEIWGDGSVIRDYLYIEDLAQAVIRLIEYRGTESLFNISSGVGLSLNELVTFIESAIGKKINRHYLDSRAFDVPVNVLSIERAKHELSWTPQVSFASGIQKILTMIR